MRKSILFIFAILVLLFSGCGGISPIESQSTIEQASKIQVEPIGLIRDNKTVYDTEAGLLWQDDTTAKVIKSDWKSAGSHCSKLELAGFSDWYLPTMKELLSITDKDSYDPTVYTTFKNITPGRYWSSSEDLSDKSNTWYVDFKSGLSYSFPRKGKLHVRCVRVGKSALTFDDTVKKLIDKKLRQIEKPNFEVELVKDMFETPEEFDARVAKTKAKQKEELLTFKKDFAEKQSRAQREAIQERLESTYGRPLLNDLKYDVLNGYFVADLTFEAKDTFKQKVAIKVPKDEARAFYAAKDTLRAEAVFEYDGKSVSLQQIEVPFEERSYLAQFTDLNIENERVAVDLSADMDMSIVSKVNIGASAVAHVDARDLKSYKDLDTLLAKAKAVEPNNKRWLFVIGIEQYEFTDNISFAQRSAEIFVKTAHKVLGVPKQNSFVMINAEASQARIKTNLKKMLRRVQKGDTIYFYYNGHGVPVPSEKNKPYLLTFDTEPDYVQDEAFFSLQNIYAKLSDSRADKVVAVVDSCFSGVTDGKAVLKGVAATRVVAKRTSFDQKKMVVLSAGKGHQYSNAYNQKGHRLFSFYVMSNILEGEKDIKSLYKETKAQTYETSLREYGDLRAQEPTIEGNARMSL